MGSTKILGQKIKNSRDWHALILQGMPARIIALGVDVFENDVSALEWPNNKQAGLGSRVPLYMLQTAPGTAKVENLLCHLKKPLQ